MHGKRLFDPYLANEIRSFFHAYDHDQLSSPRKPLVREALCDHLKGLPDGSIAVGVRLQIGSGVDKMLTAWRPNHQSIREALPFHFSAVPSVGARI